MFKSPFIDSIVYESGITDIILDYKTDLDKSSIYEKYEKKFYEEFNFYLKIKIIKNIYKLLGFNYIEKDLRKSEFKKNIIYMLRNIDEENNKKYCFRLMFAIEECRDWNNGIKNEKIWHYKFYRILLSMLNDIKY